MKTCQEWSLEFDLLYQNITSNQAPGLLEYEKSLFLTRAQNVVVIGLYNGTFGHAFESTEEVTAYLDTLVRQADLDRVNSAQVLTDKSVVFKNPSDLLFRTIESCTITVDNCGERSVPVVPVTQDEFWRTTGNPFKGQNSRKVLRLSFGETPSSGLPENRYSELVSDYPIVKYTVRYLAKPEPIILEDLEDGLTIDGYTEAHTCELNEAIHFTILTEAVRMAKVAWTA